MKACRTDARSSFVSDHALGRGFELLMGPFQGCRGCRVFRAQGFKGLGLRGFRAQGFKGYRCYVG